LAGFRLELPSVALQLARFNVAGFSTTPFKFIPAEKYNIKQLVRLAVIELNIVVEL